MSAAEHLQEAINVGCTRDDHDHVADHRAEVLAEVDAHLAAMTLPEELHHTVNAGTYRHAWLDCRAVVKEMAAGKGTGGAQAPAGESTQPAPALCACWRFPVVHRADLHDEQGLVRDITPVASGVWGALVHARCTRCGWQSRQRWFHEDFDKSPAQTIIARHRNEATGKCTAGGEVPRG